MMHVLKYARSNKYLPTIMISEKSVMIKWYIDETYAVHPNMIGHTRGGLTLGQVFPISASIKQEINTRSSNK